MGDQRSQGRSPRDRPVDAGEMLDTASAARGHHLASECRNGCDRVRNAGRTGDNVVQYAMTSETNRIAQLCLGVLWSWLRDNINSFRARDQDTGTQRKAIVRLRSKIGQ